MLKPKMRHITLELEIKIRQRIDSLYDALENERAKRTITSGFEMHKLMGKIEALQEVFILADCEKL